MNDKLPTPEQLEFFKSTFIDVFLGRVEDRTPVLTGALKAGYEVEETDDGFDISNTQPYFQYVELGTEHMAPQAMVGTTLLELDSIAEEAARRAGLK